MGAGFGERSLAVGFAEFKGPSMYFGVYQQIVVEHQGSKYTPKYIDGPVKEGGKPRSPLFIKR
jgi:hypothetical protein